MTGVRVQRLSTMLRAVPSSAGAMAVEGAALSLWRVCGGPFEEARELLAALKGLALVREQADRLSRTSAGDRVAKALAGGDLRPFGKLLIQAGVFHDQARTLLERGAVGEDGALRCPAKLARVGAPQLLGILSYWPEVTFGPQVTVPPALLADLNSVWAIFPPPPEVPSWAIERKAIGNRAEAYTVQLERSRVRDPALVAWVARDTDALGWDVEVRTMNPARCIEVKGSRGTDVVFFMSQNEWQQAGALGAKYEVHFWGEIDLKRDPALEYAALVASGYPIVLRDPAGQVQRNECSATAVRWKVEKPPRA